MTTITFTVDGQPLPKQRPRIANGHAYTPQKTKAWEALVQAEAWIAMQGRYALARDVAVTMVFRRHGSRRADCDNLQKSCLDGMNGVVYEDDSQIVQLHAEVQYGHQNPGVDIEVRTLE
jgi:Holliday junction resolvase RusA-like endonuclease